MPRKPTRVALWTLGISLLCCGSPILYVLQPWPAKAFDSQVWLQDTQYIRPMSGARYRMRHSTLQYLQDHRGALTQKQVEQLLGDPEYSYIRTGKNKDSALGAHINSDDIVRAASESGNELHGSMIGYVTMNAPPFPGSYAVKLWVSFEKDGKLEKAWINDW